jgi:hypothetical protein
MGRQRLLHVAPALTLTNLYAQPTQCINVFCMDLTRNSDHFPPTTLTIFITGTYCIYCAVRAEYMAIFVVKGIKHTLNKDKTERRGMD